MTKKEFIETSLTTVVIDANTKVFTSDDMEWLYSNAIQSYDNLKDIIKPKQ